MILEGDYGSSRWKDQSPGKDGCSTLEDDHDSSSWKGAHFDHYRGLHEAMTWSQLVDFLFRVEFCFVKDDLKVLGTLCFLSRKTLVIARPQAALKGCDMHQILNSRSLCETGWRTWWMKLHHGESKRALSLFLQRLGLCSEYHWRC